MLYKKRISLFSPKIKVDIKRKVYYNKSGCVTNSGGVKMIEAITGSIYKEKILLYLILNPLSYPNEIARNFEFNLSAVQKQLEKLESARVVCSRLKGRVRLYEIDPRYPFKKELEALLIKVYSYLDQETKDKYYIKRTRPRKPGKRL